jgi:hypothetical protein|tara:strand:- start:277 stop:396 length:120 start_codon:yes stop_codon:yes gene_type:complete
MRRRGYQYARTEAQKQASATAKSPAKKPKVVRKKRRVKK